MKRQILDEIDRYLADEEYRCMEYQMCYEADFLSSLYKAVSGGDYQRVRDLVFEYDDEMGDGEFTLMYGSAFRDMLMTYDLK